MTETQEGVAPPERAEPPPPLVLTGNQAAALLGVSRRHFDSLVAAGRMPAPYYLSRQSPRWLPGELEEAVKQLPRRPRKARAG